MSNFLENQYLELCNRIIKEGVMIENERTGKGCLTVINADFVYDTSDNKIPLVTTRQSFVKAAIAEMLGYLRGYNSAEQFRAIGCKTWDANANENKSWLANQHRTGIDAMGRVYGVQGRDWQRAPTEQEYKQMIKLSENKDQEGLKNIISYIQGNGVDQLQKIYTNLSSGIDDRGEVLTFWNPGEFDQGCLRPCMHTHTFSKLGDTLHLTSFQRSIDVPLGLVFNMPQTVVLLRLMAQITGLKSGNVYHKLINCHIYDNQIDLMKEQLKRKPFDAPELTINDKIKTLEDIETWVTKDDFKLVNYKCHDPIKYPFAV
jgi:thymidylate synthase